MPVSLRSFLAPASRAAVVWVVTPALLLTGVPRTAAAPSGAEAARPPRAPQVQVNRTVPEVAPPPSQPVFSAAPTDAEIRRARVFAEPLLPVEGRSRAPGENAALARAIAEVTSRGTIWQTEPLTTFLAAYPESAWAPSLRANLGVLQRHSGLVSFAFDSWRGAWDAAKDATDPDGIAVADFAIGQAIRFAAELGYREQLDSLLADVGSRTVRGPAGAHVRYGRLVRQQLRARPDQVIPSGPKALEHVLIAHGRAPETIPPVIRRALGRAEGMSLREVRMLARGAGATLRALRRTPTARPLVPSIVHFRFGHFSALIRQEADRYLLRDPALGGDLWVSREALAVETSPVVLTATSPSEGWVEAPEADVTALVGHSCPPRGPSDECPHCPKVGMGGGGSGGGGGPRGSCPGPSCGMPTYTFGEVNAALVLTDTPVGYTPPRGPAVAFTLTYSSREVLLPQVMTFANLGPHWSTSWISTLEEVPTYCPPMASCTTPYVRVNLAAGWRESYEGMAADGTYPRHWQSRAQLVQTSADPIRYERRLTDGTVEVYDLADGAPAGQRRLFRTAIIDPRGQALHFTYDAQLRLVAVTDALGQVTTLAYEEASDPLKITRVTDPFGRTATLTYTSAGQLASLTDVIGLTSQLTYEADDFVAALRTPYGLTTFRREQNLTDTTYFPFIEATDPLGDTERLEFRWSTTDIPAARPANEVPAGFEAYNHDLDLANSLYWSRRAWRQAPGDVNAAVVMHWMMAESSTYASAPSVNVPHTVKRPLEGRVWYSYPGQSAATPDLLQGFSQPARTARLLDDGSTELSQATYNELGQVTSRTDPLGRTTTYTYDASGRDLREVRQTSGAANDLLASYGGYTALHQPTTITDAAGQTTALTYTAAGEVATVTNARQETTTYAYDGNGFLQSVTGPVTGATTSYTYDGYGRVRTVTDVDGATVTTDYDALDRPTRVTYSDGTYEETTYDKLDAATRRDRAGRATRFFVNARREPTATRDPLGRLVQWSEDRLIDALGQTTTWERDVQGRVTREVRADGLTATSYAYEPASGRLQSVTDPKQQVTTYTYALDGAVTSLTFTNAQVATPGVTYTYDPAYSRVVTMVDGTGTTSYAYHAAGLLGAGHVASVDGPLADDTITYTYDVLGRVQARAINGVGLTYSYDALGRVTEEVNALGAFTYGYDGASGRLASVTYPNGQTSAYSYFVATQGLRLQTIHHRYPSGQTLSRFDYTYDSVGNILTWRQQADSTATLWEYGYDAADQLTRAVQRSTDATPVVLKRYAYGYDLAGNRRFEQIDDSVSNWTYDSLNRLVAQYAGGPLRVAGSVNEPATVTVNGMAAALDATNGFATTVPSASGSNTLTIAATDPSGNTATATYTVDQAGPAKTFTFDANGNLTSDGTRAFEWDARNQLVAVTVGTHRSEFTYDGLQRRVRQVEKENSVTQSDTRVLWCEDEQCEERETDGASSRLFAQAEQLRGLMRFLTRDHLGSVRDVVDLSGSVLGRYRYSPWGAFTLEAGAADITQAFTGHRRHNPTGLSLTLYRAYDPDLARWVSSDPLGLRAGPHLAAYVTNNPVNAIDRHGLQRSPPFPPPGVTTPALPAGYRRPDGSCCSQQEIEKAKRTVQRHQTRMRRGRTPVGAVAGSLMKQSSCDPRTGWCTPFPPPPDSDFDPNTTETDPCVRYCITVHEWVHFNDSRRWRLSWSTASLTIYTEWPAYEQELKCLQSF